MVKFLPCPDYGAHTGCYRCAVEFVISEIGWKPDCPCFCNGTQFCGKDCGQIRDEWAIAFAMADPPHTELARQRWMKRGQSVKRVWQISGDGLDKDITEAVMLGRLPSSDEGVYCLSGLNIEKAADALVEDVESDPVSFDAALQLVSEQIKLGKAIPEALRGWAADVLVGNLKPPKKNGKYRSATHRRDKLIVQLIEDVMDMTKLKPTSGKRELGQSVSNAVADGLKLLRRPPDSFESIIKIWRRRKDLSGVKSKEPV